MKKIMIASTSLLMMAVLFTSNATAAVIVKPVTEKNSVMATPPPAVRAAFTARFGNVPVREWKLRSNGNWRAHFLRNGVAWEATYTVTGVLVKLERA